MLIGYSMPVVTAISLSGGAGYAWLTTDNGTACYDCKPARRSRFRWRNDGVPAIAHTVSITLTWASAAPIRVVAALGLRNIAAGTKVEIYGKRAGDAGTTYNFTGGNVGSVVQFADGSLGVWWVLPVGSEAVQRVEFRFYNDLAGATWATAATTVDVGELVAMPAVDIDIQTDWVDVPVDPTETILNRAGQPATVRRQPYRRLEVVLTAEGVLKVRGGGLANGMDWSQLRTAMCGGQRLAALARWQTPAGAVDAAELNRTALYGTARMGATAHLGGDYYGASVVFQEVPALT